MRDLGATPTSGKENGDAYYRLSVLQVGKDSSPNTAAAEATAIAGMAALTEVWGVGSRVQSLGVASRTEVSGLGCRDGCSNTGFARPLLSRLSSPLPAPPSPLSPTCPPPPSPSFRPPFALLPPSCIFS
jgi:hypothetical protein